MGLRIVLLVVAGWMLGCGVGCGASAPPVEAAPPAMDPDAQRALVAYHLGLLSKRMDAQCPEHALNAVLDAGAEADALPPCAVDVRADEVALLGWLELLVTEHVDLLEQLRGLGEPHALPTDPGCEGPDPQELVAALDLAVALRHRLRDETSTASVAALTLRALIRQQLTTALDRKWTAGDRDAVDQARPLIPTTSRESMAAQIMAMFERDQVEPDQTCFVEDASAAPWAHRDSWVRGRFLNTPATITGPRILFRPALFNYDGVTFDVLSSRLSIGGTLAALESYGAAQIPWPNDASPQPGAVLLQRVYGEFIHLQVLLPGTTEHMIVHASVARKGEPGDTRLRDLTGSLATLTRPPDGEVVDAPVAVDDATFTWRSSSTFPAPNWTWTEEPQLFASTHPMIAVAVLPAIADPCSQSGVTSSPVVRFGLRGCEILQRLEGRISVTTVLTYGSRVLTINAIHPDAPGDTDASTRAWAHGILDQMRLLRAP